MAATTPMRSTSRRHAVRRLGGLSGRSCTPGMPTTASAALTSADTPNAHRQSTSAARPPMSGADVCPAACNEPNQPSARPSRSGGTVLASAANSIGVVNALAAPCNARPPRNTASVGATAQSSEAAVYPT
jgi:hypothetical protein